MPSQAHLASLQRRLESHDALLANGFGFSLEPDGHLVVERSGHVRGFWQCDGDAFTWTPAGYNEPTHRAEDETGAASLTLALLTRS